MAVSCLVNECVHKVIYYIIFYPYLEHLIIADIRCMVINKL